MSDNYISVGVFKEFWKTKRFKKEKKYNSRKQIEEKVKEIALTYHDEITPLESDGSKDYSPEIEFLDYCHSGTPSGWNLVFTGMALLNFSDSVIETFNIQDDEVVEYCLDEMSVTSEVRFNKLIDIICEELNIIP